MIQPLESIDSFALNKVFTPFAHYIQRKCWTTSYVLSKFFCEITAALVVLVAVYYAFFLQTSLTVLSAISIVTALAISVIYYYVSTQLYAHLQRGDAWQKEPLIAARAFATVDWYFPVCFIFAVISVTGIPGLFWEYLTVRVTVEVVNANDVESAKPIGSMLAYHVIRILRDISEASALYLLRVRPLPPSLHEERREESLNPI